MDDLSGLIRCRATHEVVNEAIRALMEQPAGTDRARAYRELLELWAALTTTGRSGRGGAQPPDGTVDEGAGLSAVDGHGT